MTGLLGDDRGRVWVGGMTRGADSVRWTAYDSVGIAHGALALPLGVTVLHVRGDRLFGVRGSAESSRVVIYAVDTSQRKIASLRRLHPDATR
jgi:hypothetical protein